MQGQHTTHLLRQVRCWLAVQTLDALADPDLLERFRRERNEAAFAVLVERHGPLVLRVCGRLLDDGHAIEDAFQATFLALARQAESIRKSTSLAAWLHGVACRVARRMRDRARRTFPAASLHPAADDDPAADVTRREMGRALHEEIDRLPERYRQVTVLCCVEGTTRDEAARRLGVPAAAVKKRLETARGLLRQRLTRRGIVPSAALLAALLEQTVGPPAVRATLLRATLEAAVSFRRSVAAAGVGSAGAVAAAKETAWTMSLAKGKALLFVLTLALLGSAASVLALSSRNGAATDDAPSRPSSAPTELGADLRDDSPLPAGATARLGTAHWQQEGEVFFVAFDQQDNQLITARQGSARCFSCHRNPFGPDQEGVEGMVRIWNLRSAKMARQLSKLADSRQLGLLVGEDGAMRVVRNASGLPTVSVAGSPAGDLLAETGPAGPIVLWDLGTGQQKELSQADPQAGLVGLAFSPDGKLLASLGAGGRVRLYDVAAGKEAPGGVAREAGRQVGWGDAVVFSPSAQLLATSGSVTGEGGATGVLDVWQRDTGKRTLQLKGRAQGSPAIGFSPDGRWLGWAAEDGTLRLTDVATGKEVRTLGKPEQTRYLAGLAFSPDGKRLATRGYDQAVRLWDVASGQQVRQLAPARAGQRLGRRSVFGVAGAVPATSLAFAHDGKLLAAAGPGGAVTFWDGASGRELIPGQKGPVTGAVFAADGRVLYSLGEDGTVRQWDVVGGRQHQSILLPAEAQGVALSPDGRAVVFRPDAKTLAVWDLAAGAEPAHVPDLERKKGSCPGCDPPGGLRLSADGKLLARIGANGAVGVWEIPSGRSRWTLDDAARAGMVPASWQTLQDLVLAADGRRLAALKAGTSREDPPAASVFLWDLDRGKLVRRLDGLKGLSTPVVLAPDGRTLATAGQDGTAALWEIATGKERMRLRAGVAGPLTALAYSPDSALIIAAGPKQTLWCWDAVTGERLGQRRGDQADVGVLAFAPDGRKLVSGGRDGTLLLWEVASFQNEERPRAPKLEPAEARQCWDDLASSDAGRAARALARFRAAPPQAVALVRRQVRPVAVLAPEKLQRWIKDLDSDDFTRREQATAELAKLGYLAEPALKKALADRPSLEVRKRIEVLLDKLPTEEPTSGEELCGLRAVELLERLAQPEADKLLQALSEGAGGARLTREARAALERRRSRAGR
jgi:RNA polymerase sigma factor (sigma-70 family)